ncbi:hypothetical protein GCM10011609_17110 [Lentzea pudingi]|uniref:Uncharacterized protein n=1 Tax=Lentzea pudingi TaxID=1789439 RepID=A0ABQ2HJ43_9PSEU|nr:hypothetical protein [Lentzea pudingi]GGM81676.1 hypothetical protein GCM10011609_17110 [Lentzea pudingi]
MTVASFVISCLAALFALGAVWYARGQKMAAEKSALEAKRSADSAAEMARIEQERRADEVADAEKLRVRFSLVHHNNAAYVLSNDGTDSAYGVHVDGQRLVARGETEFEVFPAGDARKYILSKAMGRPDHIIVTWHTRPDRTDAANSAKFYI